MAVFQKLLTVPAVKKTRKKTSGKCIKFFNSNNKRGKNQNSAFKNIKIHKNIIFYFLQVSCNFKQK